MKTLKKEKKSPQDGLKAKGFFRLQIEDGPSGEIVGDSGWRENQITNIGFTNYIVGPLFALGASSLASLAALGSGTAPASNGSALGSELLGTNNSVHRVTCAMAATASNRSGVQYTATFSSTLSFVTAQVSLQNVGLFGHSTTNSIAMGNTYATSTCDTNQNCNLTYILSFS